MEISAEPMGKRNPVKKIRIEKRGGSTSQRESRRADCSNRVQAKGGKGRRAVGKKEVTERRKYHYLVRIYSA